MTKNPNIYQHTNSTYFTGKKGWRVGSKMNPSHLQPCGWEGVGATHVASNAATQFMLKYLNEIPFFIARNYLGGPALFTVPRKVICAAHGGGDPLR